LTSLDADGYSKTICSTIYGDSHHHAEDEGKKKKKRVVDIGNGMVLQPFMD
jgi:hypothetical protein